MNICYRKDLLELLFAATNGFLILSILQAQSSRVSNNSWFHPRQLIEKVFYPSEGFPSFPHFTSFRKGKRLV